MSQQLLTENESPTIFTGIDGKPRYRQKDAMRALGIKSEHTISAWEKSCAYLDGDPFTPEDATVEVSQKNQWRQMSRPYQVKTYGIEEIERINQRRIDVASGRYVDKDGTAWLSTARALETLKKARPELTRGVFLDWTRGEGSPQRELTAREPGFMEGLRAKWFLETEVEKLKATLKKMDQGYFGEKTNRCLTVPKIKKKYGWSARTLRWWGKWCPYLRSRQLKPQFHKGGRYNKNGKTKTYRIADLEAIKTAMREPWTGAYDDGTRFNLALAAELSDIPINSLRSYMKAGRLPHEERMRTSFPWGWEETVTEADLGRLRAQIKNVVNEPLPEGDWKSAKEIANCYGVKTRQGQIRLQILLSAFRDAELIDTAVRVREVESRQKRRKIWFYDFGKLEEIRGEKDVKEFVCEWIKKLEAETTGETQALEISGAMVDGLGADEKNSNETYKADPNEFLPIKTLAELFLVNHDRLKHRLFRWRSKNILSKAWREISNRGSREPQFEFLVSVAMPIIQKLKAKLERNSAKLSKS